MNTRVPSRLTMVSWLRGGSAILDFSVPVSASTTISYADAGSSSQVGRYSVLPSGVKLPRSTPRMWSTRSQTTWSDSRSTDTTWPLPSRLYITYSRCVGAAAAIPRTSAQQLKMLIVFSSVCCSLMSYTWSVPSPCAAYMSSLVVDSEPGSPRISHRPSTHPSPTATDRMPIPYLVTHVGVCGPMSQQWILV